MPNPENLIPQAHKLTVEEQSKGGKASVEARRNKKTIQKILNDVLDADSADFEFIEKIAKKMGLTGEKSVRDVYTIFCLFNKLKKGDLNDLLTLTKLCGEETEYNNGNEDVEEMLCKIKECAYEYGNKQETS